MTNGKSEINNPKSEIEKRNYVLHKYKAVLLSLFLIAGFAVVGTAQKTKDAQGSITQRLDVMRQKLETMRRSLNSAASVLKDETKDDKGKKDDKSKLETPLGRLRGLEKEASTLQSEVNSLRGKVDRAEKYEVSEVDQIEATVGELQTRTDNALTETAGARANPVSAEGTAREVKKKKKFLGIFGGGNDEYEELIGTVTPGRDRELFVVATKEVRKNNYDVGRLLFQTIITTYPDSAYLPMAKLAVADSFYLEGSTSALIQSAAAYQEWLTFFPTHPLADRVLLKVAESEMRQIGLPDRDSTRARRAEQRLRALLQQYPNSILKDTVNKRLEEVQDNLGLHNLYIANYYYTQSVNQKKSGLKGAQSRYREILDKYPNFSFMDEALFKLAVTYQIEEETDQAAELFSAARPRLSEQRLRREIEGAVEIDRRDDSRCRSRRGRKFSHRIKFRLSPISENELFGLYPLTIDKDGVLMTNKFDETAI